MIPIPERIEAARRLIGKQRSNIRFMEERIKLQKEPDYNPIREDGIKELQYYPLDLQLAQDRLKEFYSTLGYLKAQL